ncbi:MAG: CvpA family protein [Candidatus Omnitrophica bacterium]|nr:CvpA family protein [Candidatus Omnitrophota bacterium]
MEILDILKRLNWVDILCIILMIRISYVAFLDGLSHEIFPLIGCVASLVISLRYYIPLATFLTQNVLSMPAEMANFLTFLVLALLTLFMVRIIKALLDKIVAVEWHPLLERFGGLVLGIFKAAIVTSLVLIILLLSPMPYFQRSIRDKSLTGMYFLRAGTVVYENISGLLPAIKIDIPSIKKEDIMGNLSSDKQLTSQEKETKK